MQSRINVNTNNNDVKNQKLYSCYRGRWYNNIIDKITATMTYNIKCIIILLLSHNQIPISNIWYTHVKISWFKKLIYNLEIINLHYDYITIQYHNS